MLQQLLGSLAHNQFQHTDLEQKFDEIAIELLRHTKLVAGSKEYFICEVEFYFFSRHYKHEDLSVHGNNKESHQQHKFGRWYFHHKFSEVEAFKKDKWKGLDITFGSKEHNNCGGILIRAIKRIDLNLELIDGPSKIVDAIFDSMGSNQFESLFNENPSAFDCNSLLRLEAFINSNNGVIFKGPRIGLSSKNPDNPFIKSKYNYFNHEDYKIVAQ
jgi:hypothetical protein